MIKISKSIVLCLLALTSTFTTFSVLAQDQNDCYMVRPEGTWTNDVSEVAPAIFDKLQISYPAGCEPLEWPPDGLKVPMDVKIWYRTCWRHYCSSYYRETKGRVTRRGGSRYGKDRFYVEFDWGTDLFKFSGTVPTDDGNIWEMGSTLELWDIFGHECYFEPCHPEYTRRDTFSKQ